jgi:HNH endonuclease
MDNATPLRGDVLSHTEMCAAEGMNLQRGMNFGRNGHRSVILMSLRPGARYADRIEDNGRVLIYEGHDVPKATGVNPKMVDQAFATPAGTLTENGRFFEAAKAAFGGQRLAERVRVYEKIKSGIWVFNGTFRLTDAWREDGPTRRVFKFSLVLADDEEASVQSPADANPTRLVPGEIKREVWKRDGGRCTKCGAADNLHFDHIIPFSLGGSSVTADNVQLLCVRHNLEKHARIA